MTAISYQSYEDATRDYLAGFRSLRGITSVRSKETTRGAADIPADKLITHAKKIAGISAKMVPLAKTLLEAPDPVLREGISGHLLAQAAAELQLAADLLQIATEDNFDFHAPVTRSVRSANLQNAISDMEKALALPVSYGLVIPEAVRRSAISAKTPGDAKKLLLQTAMVTADAISMTVVEFGSDVALNLIGKTEWTAVIEGAGLLKKEIGEKLDAVKKGLGEIIIKAVTVAVKTLLNVYDKIMALLGKDAEDKVRKQIKDWLEKIKKGGKIELFESLVSKLYRLDSFSNDLSGWLENSKAGKEIISKTAGEVSSVGDRFKVLIKRMNMVEDVIGMARFIKVPQLVAVLAGIQVGLLGIIVYSGYDYIGYKQGSFLNLTKGVAEVIRENLRPDS